MKPGTVWIAVAGAAAALVLVAAVAVELWRAVGDSTISLAGWLALGFGITVTLALGVGLMGLVFISSRRGYDDPAHRDR
jgi:hypothetical protein